MEDWSRLIKPTAVKVDDCQTLVGRQAASKYLVLRGKEELAFGKIKPTIQRGNESLGQM
jgi:hypothetical protein